MSEALFALHRALVQIPSVSKQEQEIADFVERHLRGLSAEVSRLGNNVFARAGAGPKILLCSHLDTVPAGPDWTRPPHVCTEEDGRIYGLGSNDAKASVAAMMLAFAEVSRAGGPAEVGLLLVPEEETGGAGAEISWPYVQQLGFQPEGVVIGEPTGLDIAEAQKGLLVLELIAEGPSCHAANAEALGVKSALRQLARDVTRLEDFAAGPLHPTLGKNTFEPTVFQAGERRNVVPSSARAWLDVRTVPGLSHQQIAAAVAAEIQSKVRIHSERLLPISCPPDARVLKAARAARPEAEVYGSRTMSDFVWFREVPGIKVGPGQTARSHTNDEFVLASELIEGLAFYRQLIQAFAKGEEGAR